MTTTLHCVHKQEQNALSRLFVLLCVQYLQQNSAAFSCISKTPNFNRYLLYSPFYQWVYCGSSVWVCGRGGKWKQTFPWTLFSLQGYWATAEDAGLVCRPPRPSLAHCLSAATSPSCCCIALFLCLSVWLSLSLSAGLSPSSKYPKWNKS